MADRTVLVVPRRRWLPLSIVLAVAALVVAAGSALARGLPERAGDAGRYRTALVATGSVQQTLTLTGTAARVGQVTVGFPMSGTVATVDVAVGDQVASGQRLATMDATALDQAVLDAESTLEQARATWESDEGAAASASPAAATSSAAASSASGAGGPAAGQVDLTALTTAGAQVAAAQRAADTACLGWLGPPGVGPASTSGAAAGSTSSTGSTGSTGSGASTTTGSGPGTDVSDGATSSTATGDPTSVEPPTHPTLADCRAALTAVTTAQRQQSQVAAAAAAALARAVSAGSAASPGSATTARASTGSAAAAGAAGGTAQRASAGAAQSTEAKLILDASSVTTAEAALVKARSQRAAADLTAPSAGVVGSIALSPGGSSTPGSGIVLVTPSAVEVTVSVPLANLPSVAVGQRATVTPAGAVPVTGAVASIAMLPNSTNATSPAYDVVVSVPEAGDTLATGAKASVVISTSRVDDVLTVPVSAVTTVATGTGSVGVLKDGVVSSATVRTGVVGQGRVQILSGLTAGQTVVLADTAAALPTNGSGGFRVVGGGGGIAGVGGAPAGAPAGGGPVPGGGGRPGG